MPRLARGLVGAADLALDLVLADDHRLEARGDAEEVPGRVAVAQRVDRLRELRRARSRRARRAAPAPRRSALAASVDDDVELGAVAARDRDRLADRAARRTAPVTNRAAWRSVSATRSRRATGATRCEVPISEQLGHGSSRSLRRRRAQRASSVSSPSSRSMRPSLPAMIAT